MNPANRSASLVLSVIGLLACWRLAFHWFPEELDRAGWTPTAVTQLVGLVVLAALMVVGPIRRALRRTAAA
ncbi:hypothetical protein GCM10027030_01680 [Luteococcus sediminum]